LSKKEDILEIAKVHFAKKGYEKTSLDDVANDLDISKPALYYYFKNKQAIYNCVFKREFKKIDISKITSLREYIFTLANFFETNSEIRQMFSKELSCKGKHLEDETIEIISKTIQKLKKIIPENINPFFIQTTIMSVLINYKNTINLRKKVADITCLDSESCTNSEIKDIKEDLYKMIQNYIKGEK
jgi:AcrR family transcriptional regulator